MKVGYGLPDCHIGMPIADLPNGFVPQEELSPDARPNTNAEGAFIDPSRGIAPNYRSAPTVFAIKFRYPNDRPAEYRNFLGRTVEGIGPESTIRHVLSTYGEPTTIANTRDVSSATRCVSLTYMELGVMFNFRNEGLSAIWVIAPESPPYDPYLTEDIGDTSELRKLSRDIAENGEDSDKQGLLRHLLKEHQD